MLGKHHLYENDRIRSGSSVVVAVVRIQTLVQPLIIQYLLDFTQQWSLGTSASKSTMIDFPLASFLHCSVMSLPLFLYYTIKLYTISLHNLYTILLHCTQWSPASPSSVRAKSKPPSPAQALNFSAIAHSERKTLPSTLQKVLGIVKDLSQKVLGVRGGAPRIPARPPRVLCVFGQFSANRLHGWTAGGGQTASMPPRSTKRCDHSAMPA